MLEAPVSVRLAAAVSTSPTVKPIAPVAAFWRMAWSTMFEIVGTSFTAVTVSRNVSLAVSVPSLTVTVIVAVPD